MGGWLGEFGVWERRELLVSILVANQCLIFFFVNQVDNQFCQKGFNVLYSEKDRALSKVKWKTRQIKWSFLDWSCLNMGVNGY